MCSCDTGIITGDAADRKAAFEPECGSWDCPRGAKAKARRIRARALAGNCNRGFDLTIRHLPHRTIEEEIALLKECWRDFRIWWEKQPRGGKIHALTVWECTGARHVHIHALARCNYVPVKILRRFFIQRINSPRQWIKDLTSKQQRIFYATKYITKQLIKLPHTHRYSFTHGFDEAKEPIPRDPFFQDMEWNYRKKPLWLFALNWMEAGWHVDLDEKRRRCLARPP